VVLDISRCKRSLHNCYVRVMLWNKQAAGRLRPWEVTSAAARLVHVMIWLHLMNTSFLSFFLCYLYFPCSTPSTV
jgi:hypothetical protein